MRARLSPARTSISLVLLAFTLPQGARAADLTQLGYVPSYGPGAVEGFGISGDGSIVVGSSACTAGANCATIWSGASLAASFPYNDSLESVARAISSDGTSVVFSTTAGVDAVIRNGLYFLFDTGGGTNDTTGAAISSNGDVVVGTYSGHATYWTWNGGGYGSAQVLPSLGAGPHYATGIDGAGATVVGYGTVAGAARAVYWSGASFGTITELDPAHAFAQTSAQAISTNGNVIIGSGSDGSAYHAIYWVSNGSGGFTAAQTTGDFGGTASYASSISGNGQIIGGNYTSGGTSHAFLFSVASGSGADLSTLLSTAGVNMSGIHLFDVAALSASGTFMVANDYTNGTAYRIFYNGTIAGVSTPEAQQASLVNLQKQRETVAIQQDAYTGVMIGDLDPQGSGNELGAFALYGSAVGGLKGRAAVTSNITLSGGFAGGTGDYDETSFRGLSGALALRYDFTAANGWRPFAQAGGSYGKLDDLSFERVYANGAGTAIGTGKTSGEIASLFARLGVAFDFSKTNQIQVSGEIGERWLTTDGYSEAFSATNPFPAIMASGRDTLTVAKGAIAWTYGLSKSFDLTVRAAVGTTLHGSSGLDATVSGFGTLTGDYQQGTWGEGAVRLGYHATDRVTLDAYATGITSNEMGTAGHVGAGVRIAY